ncbi:MAG: hypothetical protein Q9219_005099 [cf. Caloplaca sp. 3 TL-2023]
MTATIKGRSSGDQGRSEPPMDLKKVHSSRYLPGIPYERANIENSTSSKLEPLKDDAILMRIADRPIRFRENEVNPEAWNRFLSSMQDPGAFGFSSRGVTLIMDSETDP